MINFSYVIVYLIFGFVLSLATLYVTKRYFPSIYEILAYSGYGKYKTSVKEFFIVAFTLFYPAYAIAAVATYLLEKMMKLIHLTIEKLDL